MVGIERRDRCLEGVGPESLPEITDALLADHETRRYDIGVVRSLFDADAIAAFQATYKGQRTDEETRDSSIRLSEALEYVSEDHTQGKLSETGAVISQFWQQGDWETRLGLSVSGRAQFVKTIRKNSRTHIDTIPSSIDTPALGADHVIGPITLSIRIDTNHDQPRLFYARRLSGAHTPTIDRRPLIPSDFERLSKRIQRRFNPVRALLCSVVEQQPGDAIVLPGHPWPSIHATKHADITWAAIFDFQLSRSR